MTAAQLLLSVAAASAAFAADADPLTSERAVAIALERNSELAVLRAEVQAAQARLAGARLVLHANPEVTAGAGPRWRGEERTTDLEFSLSQRIEVGGQRGARIDVTSAEGQAAEARLAARRVAVAAEVRAAFARALAADRLGALAREDVAVTKDAVAAVARRVELGGTPQLELNAARAEAGRAARAVGVASRRSATARAELAALLATDPATPLDLQGDLQESGAELVLDPDALASKAMLTRPELEASHREVAAAEAEERLAGREVIPSPVVGARYSREEGADILVGTVTFELPLFNRNVAAKGVASARLARAQAELAAAERHVRAEVRFAVERLRTAAEAVAAFQGEVVAAAEANVGLASRAYESGKIGLAELLLVRRGALEARRDHVEALQELAEARSDLARAVGSAVLVGGSAG